MKKKLFVFLVAILLVLQSSFLVAVADTQAEPEADTNPNGYFVFNTLIVKATEYRNPKLYSPGNEWLFFGEVATSVSLNADVETEEEAKALLEKDGYLEYTVKFWDSQDFLDIKKRLNEREEVISADMIYSTENNFNVMGVDERGSFYAAGDLIIGGTIAINTADYKDGGELNGIPVKSIRRLTAWKDITYYVVHMDNTVNIKEAEKSFSETEGIDTIEYNYLAFPDEWLGTRNIADVDDDGDIDSMDYVLLKRAYFGIYKIYGNTLVRCDINKNDDIDSMDYVLAKRIYFGSYAAE